MLNYFYVLLCIIAGIWACVEFFKKQDEIPVFLGVFTYLTLSRLPLLESGEEDWISFDYGIDFVFNMDYAYIVSNLILLGTFVLLFSYLFSKKTVYTIKDNDKEFTQFISSQKTNILSGFIIFFVFSLVAKGSLSMGYAFLLTLANTSFIILLFLYVLKGKTTVPQRYFFAVLMIFLAYSTYNPGLRFQFLGWSIPCLFFATRNLGIGKKILTYSLGGFLLMIVFSMAGALRNPENINKPIAEVFEEGKSRLFSTEDINFIDGFVMLYQIYPEYLDYHYGADHLAVLLRPIPRSLWPGKPVGGWHQKYANKYNEGEEFGTGISTTLYGVFYGEGGEIGIVIFAILWGIGLARIMKISNSYSRELQSIIKGMLLAALIPIMRSGDLAGDIAIVCMSYWPIFIFLHQYNKFLKEESIQISEEQATFS